MPRVNAQHQLDKIRPPKVHITYDVETGGAKVNKELPFAVGVMGDFSGKPKEPLPKLGDRKFVEIDRDNFNKILEGMKPRLVLSVENKLEPGAKINVELNFETMDDFLPGNVAKQVPKLQDLLARRTRLANIRSRLQGNDNLGEALLDAISPEKRDKLKAEIADDGGSNG